MRLRHNPNAKEFLLNNPNVVIQNPQKYKGKWRKHMFKNSNEIHIEVGTGKGDFLIEMAQKNPNVNYIGIEKYPSVLFIALKKMLENPLQNLKFIDANALKLNEIFNESEISQIYLNFSDPWPKARHEKRRLTYKNFLNIFKIVMNNKALLCFKTDNDNLFNYSLESFELNQWEIINIQRDLHKTKWAKQNNVMTEYEKKFSSKGKNINRVVAKPLLNKNELKEKGGY